MGSKSSHSKPKLFTLSIISFFIVFVYLSISHSPKRHETIIHTLHNQKQPTEIFPRHVTRPSWYKYLENETKNTKFKIGLVNLHGTNVEVKDLHDEAELVNVHFRRVNQSVTWKDLFPEWIDENVPQKSSQCPEIPMPELDEYADLDVVLARVPCANATNVFRLQVNLVVANLLVKNGWGFRDISREMYVVFVGPCSPMLEIFRCDDQIWYEGNAWIYKPDLRRLKQKVLLPVGTCQLASPFAESGQEEWRKYTSSDSNKKPREAYVTVLHSSESYVCGAIALAQSIILSNSTKDLILLVDNSISHESLNALKLAGWKIKVIERIRNPHAKRGTYNEWNYSKLRIWQLVEYDKLIFVDSDFLFFKNIDPFFMFPQLSAAGNCRHVFNSGIMIIEPSECTFKTLMEKTLTIVSYNGGDQGFLNEVFSWWHRWPAKLNYLKNFQTDERRKYEYPEDAYAMHYLGLKPWMCYKDYDCNWDVLEYRDFPNDRIHAKWWQVYDLMPKELQKFCYLTPDMDTRIRLERQEAKAANFSDGHWKIQVKDPRRLSDSDI
ncbi:putative UDP-glucuronate:xylan alpha-glucuronosyltransferase 4 [Nicotiana tabacum]|uniref:Hexosyltransferase n=1 Tax=Nicotiana tabacum TaxID=4097 RepID=A0A1S3XVE7_TOBAC|nr:PREDICTED: putative UDP-glucuronate:xylan alpha-glucuronosyltransferase 4 [Nicotiana tabacum]